MNKKTNKMLAGKQESEVGSATTGLHRTRLPAGTKKLNSTNLVKNGTNCVLDKLKQKEHLNLNGEKRKKWSELDFSIYKIGYNDAIEDVRSKIKERIQKLEILADEYEKSTGRYDHEISTLIEELVRLAGDEK